MLFAEYATHHGAIALIWHRLAVDDITGLVALADDQHDIEPVRMLTRVGDGLFDGELARNDDCLLYTSPSPRDS